MKSITIDEYFEALERIKNNTPIRVSKGSKLTNDNVSLEAGRKKGTIKKSRPVFDELIEEINKAKSINDKQLNQSTESTNKYKLKYKEYRTFYEDALNRELMYLERLDNLEKTNNLSSHTI